MVGGLAGELGETNGTNTQRPPHLYITTSIPNLGFYEVGATSHLLALSRSVLYCMYVRQTEMGKVRMRTVSKKEGTNNKPRKDGTSTSWLLLLLLQFILYNSSAANLPVAPLSSALLGLGRHGIGVKWDKS